LGQRASDCDKQLCERQILPTRIANDLRVNPFGQDAHEIRKEFTSSVHSGEQN
jgi:hypothetical protein